VGSKNRKKMTDRQARALWPVFEQLGGGSGWPTAIKPERVWAEVKRDRQHPLRAWYTWNLREGWEQYGIDRTRWLIQQVAVRGIVFRGLPREFVARALVHMPKSDTHETGYRPIQEVLREERNDDIQTRQRLKYLRQWAGASRGVLGAIESTNRTASVLLQLITEVEAAIASAVLALTPPVEDAAE
jgi:hypothetical protein